MKRSVIIKDPKAHLFYRDTAIEVKSMFGDAIIGFNQITHIYLHQNIDLPVKQAIQIAKKVPLFFIDKRGKIIARISFAV